MQSIDLTADWYLAQGNSPQLDALVWQKLDMPLAVLAQEAGFTPLYLQRRFEMGPNEHCASWWWETESELEGELWINGQAISLDNKQIPSHLDITDAIAIGENTIILRLAAPQLASIHTIFCVPYPCP